MKKISMALIIPFTLLFLCSKENNQSVLLKKDTPEYQLAEKIAATIPYFNPEANNVLAQGKGLKITTGTVIKKVYFIFGNRSKMIESMPETRLRDFIKTNSENVIQEILLLNQIKKEKIKVSESELDSAMQSHYKDAGGEEQFMEQLKANQIQLDDILNDVKTRLLINKYFNTTHRDEITPTEQEITNQYNQDVTATVRHILFLTQEKTPEEKTEVRKIAEEVLAKARAGKDFGGLAKKYSEDPGSKDKGGLYENFTRGYMVKPFEDASFNLPVGSISDLVETQYGYHIVKVESRQKETRPLTEVRETLVKQLEGQKRKDIYDKEIADLKAAAAVEYAPF
jgi:parvulin-like peptidyl-prolyl isomerase